MLRLHQIYLRQFITLFIILFFIVGGVVYLWLKEYYISQTKYLLEQNIELSSFILDDSSSFDSFAKNVKNKLGLRLTIINKDGIVVAESHEDKTKMDNHRYREEIMDSNKHEFGVVIRHSDTVKKDFLYVAKRYIKDEEQTYYIRMAKELDTITHAIVELGEQVGVVLSMFFIIALYIAYKISTRIQIETNKIMQFLYDLTKKKKSSYINSDYSIEFFKITKHLTKVSKILTKQNKQKDKYTAKLKASNSQKDDIISAISHEFKNPIAVINGYSQTLLEDENINSDIRKKFLTKIQKNGQRLSSLIDTLRLSIKLDEKKQPLRYSNVNLYDMVHDSVDSLLSANYKNRDIKLIGATDVKIKADETLLGVAVTNLIENALKYSEDKVVVIVDENFIQIEDSGIGIKEEDIEKVTNKFYRVSNNGWNNSLGLGLSIVSNIISMHNFKLEIKSKENEGSVFKIVF